MKKIYRLLLFAFFIFTLLLHTSSFAYAVESVEDFENNVKAAWHNPDERISQLRAQEAKLIGHEDKFASLYEVERSDIYSFIAEIRYAISNYVLIKDEIKHHNKHLISTVSLENQINDKSKKHKFAVFFEFIESHAHFVKLLNDAINNKASLEQLRSEYESNFSSLENAYRIEGDNANYDINKHTKEAFKYQMARIKLENYLVLTHFYQLHLDSLGKDIQDYEKAIGKIVSVASNMLKNVDTHTINTAIWEKRSNKVLSFYLDTYESLREDDTVWGLTQEELQLLPVEFSGMLQNVAQTEKKYVYTMYGEWLDFLPFWHTLVDVFDGKKPISATEQISQSVDYFCKYTDDILLNRLEDIEASITTIEGWIGEEALQINFCGAFEPKIKNYLEKLKQRKLTYKRLHIFLQNQYATVDTVARILQKKTGDKAVRRSLRKLHFDDFLHWELFSIAYRPITVAKIGKTLQIILCAYLIIFLFHLVIGKSQIRKHSGEIDGYLSRRRLILEKTIAIVVYILAFLCILTVLNVPLTVFAYMGGVGAIAIGFGAQTIFANLFSGLLLIYGDKIRVGDWVIVDDTLGRVENITSQNTIIIYDDFTQHMIVPNSLMIKDTVRNVTRSDGLIYDSFDVIIEDVHDLSRAIAAIYRKKDSIKELLPNYFFAARRGRISGIPKLRPSIIVSYTYDVKLISAEEFKEIIRKAVYDALIEEGIYDLKKTSN